MAAPPACLLVPSAANIDNNNDICKTIRITYFLEPLSPSTSLRSFSQTAVRTYLTMRLMYVRIFFIAYYPHPNGFDSVYALVRRTYTAPTWIASTFLDASIAGAANVNLPSVDVVTDVMVNPCTGLPPDVRYTI